MGRYKWWKNKRSQFEKIRDAMLNRTMGMNDIHFVDMPMRINNERNRINREASGIAEHLRQEYEAFTSAGINFGEPAIPAGLREVSRPEVPYVDWRRDESTDHFTDAFRYITQGRRAGRNHQSIHAAINDSLMRRENWERAHSSSLAESMAGEPLRYDARTGTLSFVNTEEP